MSLQILQNEYPSIRHTLWDNIESAFWVFIYEALLYLEHPMDPLSLSKRMRLLFAKITRHPADGWLTGGDAKKEALGYCLCDQGCFSFIQFENLAVNRLINELGEVLGERYFRITEPSFNLDDPDQKWFSRRLRKAAMKMEPLCITPTGLKSPTNDSKPPVDPGTWESASISDSEMDLKRSTGCDDVTQRWADRGGLDAALEIPGT
ncbi:hypothetical protein BYT27DRAFT_7259620 [Phlegmacium glaucopus]|nr:hypothetical protein BYT27DRAFT_7259620 [Phlegmacium glaucopus]